MKAVRSNKGAILVFVLIINTVLIVTSTALLSTVMMDYKMKKVNSKVKKAFYHAESGLEEAYALTIEFLTSALESLEKWEEVTEERLSASEINSVFSDIVQGKSDRCGGRISLKALLQDKDNYISDGVYPKIEVELEEIKVNRILEHLEVTIKSTYEEDKITKSIALSFDILLPDCGAGFITANDLIQRESRVIVR